MIEYVDISVGRTLSESVDQTLITGLIGKVQNIICHHRRPYETGGPAWPDKNKRKNDE